ncbi:MAG TPA: response regulator [Thermoanaerobaculia bacterium]|nr:response regulator [Thermoanaerobaculia bacterium]
MSAERRSRPLKRRFELVLLSVTGILLILVAATMIVVRSRDQKQLLEQTALMFAETTNDQICQQYRVYYHSGSYKFREIVRRTMAWNPDVHRLLILSVAGEVLYDSSESTDYNLQTDRPSRRIEDPRLVDATAELNPQVFRARDPRLGDLLMVVSPYIEEWGRHPYSVVYVFTYRSLDAAMRAAALPVAALLSGSLIIMALVARGLGTRVARPIEDLTRRVRSFEEGRHREIAGPSGSLEIQELSETFERMATRLEEHVQKLETANEELKTLDRLKTDLLANVSHELRTPLSAIRGYVEFMSDGNLGPVSAEQGRALSICLRNIDRLNKNINMLLDFSRMELGRVAINPAPFRLDVVLRQTLASLEAEVRKKKVVLESAIAEPLPAVVGDRDRLVQVFENLVVNAIKFTPPGGRIWVSAEPDPAGREVRLSVADSGIGIAGPERERIFAKFYQVEAGAARRFGGVGLGLAIVKSILDAHRVEISVEDRAGGGTVFRFALPVAAPRAAQPALPSGEAVRDSRPVRILAIDDDADFLSYLVDALRGEGREVVTAATADQGLAMARSERPDLILLDVFLPDRNGFDVLQALKADPATHAIPTLLVTVVNEKPEGFRLGARDYLMKPVEGAVLVEAVETALSRRDPAGATILVVDDEPDVTSFLSTVLSARGYRTIEAASGAEALAIGARDRPDLILLDVMMPGMTGWEVLRRLRESALADVPVIVLSARESPEDVAEGLRFGVRGYLGKTAGLDRLIAEIRSALGGPPPAEAAP